MLITAYGDFQFNELFNSPSRCLQIRIKILKIPNLIGGQALTTVWQFDIMCEIYTWKQRGKLSIRGKESKQAYTLFQILQIMVWIWAKNFWTSNFIEKNLVSFIKRHIHNSTIWKAKILCFRVIKLSYKSILSFNTILTLSTQK